MQGLCRIQRTKRQALGHEHEPRASTRQSTSGRGRTGEYAKIIAHPFREFRAPAHIRKKMSGFALESSRPSAVPRYVEAVYVRQRTEPHADMAYFRVATPGGRKSVQMSGFRKTIKRNSHEVFNRIFSGTNGAGVTTVG